MSEQPQDLEPHKPTGTFYTPEDAALPACVCGGNDWIHSNSQGEPYRQGYAICGHCGLSTSEQEVAPTEEPDTGPPAPGEGDDLPNPELETKC